MLYLMTLSGFCNICANLSFDEFRRVKVKRAVDVLNNMKVDSSHLIFMTNCPVYTQIDRILKFQGPVTLLIKQSMASLSSINHILRQKKEIQLPLRILLPGRSIKSKKIQNS